MKEVNETGTTTISTIKFKSERETIILMVVKGTEKQMMGNQEDHIRVEGKTTTKGKTRMNFKDKMKT